jgi:toxin ParE1/3/4
VRLRFTRNAEATIEQALLDSARQHGEAAAGRYAALIRAALVRIADAPDAPGTATTLGMPGVRAFPLRLVRLRVEAERRVGRPRHILLDRVGVPGDVEVLGIVHDRMEMARAARRLAHGSGPG